MTSTLSRRADPPEDDAPGRGWSRRTIAILAGVLVLLAGAATWVVAFSSLLGVRTIDVRGEHAVTTQRILAAANVADGTPLVRLDTDAIAARVESIQGVYSARVSTSYPSTLVISVVERVPVGAIHVDDHYVLVDKTGDQYRTVDTAPAHLPVFVVPTGAAARATGGAVATVAAALPPSVRAHVASIQALDPSAVTLLLTDQRVVRWGSVARSAEKARILPELLRQSGSTFDVTDPERPFSR